MFSKHRVEALSDGVFAIVMTLLVLDLKVPDEAAKGHLAQALLQERHEWISFLVTFGIASVFWVLQHRLFDLLEDIHPRAIFPTFLFLGLVAVLPFSTSLWGHHINDRVALAVYFGNQCLIGAALLLKFELVRAGGHLPQTLEVSMMRLRLAFFCIVYGSAVLSAVLLPVQYVAFVPITLGLIARKVRSTMRRRYQAHHPVLST